MAENRVRSAGKEKETVCLLNLAYMCPASVEGWRESYAGSRGRRIADARRGIDERKMRRGVPEGSPELDDGREEKSDGVEEAAWRWTGCLVDGTSRPGCAGSS
jgi:hypothetical protein